MAQTSEDWGDISDSEFLDIQLEPFLEEPRQSVKRDDTVNNSQDTFPESLNRTEKRSVQSTVKTEEQRALKRERCTEDGGRHQLRFWKQHLSVSTLCEQAWCEMKLVYDFQNPRIRRQDMKRCEVQAGTAIHLARELEVQKVVPVYTQRREDVMAVALLNVLGMIPHLEAGECVREFPVFGVLEGVHIKGVIDELTYNQKGELVLNELKTRRDNCLPFTSQSVCHNFQVGLYKLLFDTVVRGELMREHIVDHLHLRDSLRLGHGVLTHAANAGLWVATFGELVDAFLQNLSSSVLPCIDVLQVEYRHQGSGDLIGTRVVSFDEANVRTQLRDHLAYWTGQRESRGVDIEEAWKCRSCPYWEICDWRKSGYQLPDTSHTTGGVFEKALYPTRGGLEGGPLDRCQTVEVEHYNL